MKSFDPISAIVCLMIAACLAWPALADNAAAGNEVVIVPKARGESAQSHAHALQLAIRDAVRRGAGTWIESQSEVQNFTLIRDSIYSRARGYAKGYDGPIKTMGMGGKLYVVEITNVKVAVGRIKERDWNALQLLIKLVGRPDFVVDIKAEDEKTKGYRLGTWIRGRINDRIEGLGLTAIDVAGEKQTGEREYIKAVSRGDKARARGLRTKLGARYGVRVTASVTVNRPGPDAIAPGVSVATVMLQGTVYSRSTAHIIASKQVARKVLLGNPNNTAAVKAGAVAAADALFDECVKRIVHNWAVQIDEGVKAEVWATKLEFEEVDGIAKALAKCEQVDSANIFEADPDGISVVKLHGLISNTMIAREVLKAGKGKLRLEIIGPGIVGCTKRPAKKPAP